VRSTTRRHRSLVRAGDAAVVLGVLGYDTEDPLCRVPCAECLARAQAWLARHDPPAVRDPVLAPAIDWTPDPHSARSYHRCPATYRSAFAAFTRTSRPPRTGDWICWRAL
jgi:hypothetical protein